MASPAINIRRYLDPAPVPDDVKADAWDAFQSAGTPQAFQAAFDRIKLPDDVKADLWDAKFPPPAPPTPTPGSTDVPGLKGMPLPGMPKPPAIAAQQAAPVGFPTPDGLGVPEPVEPAGIAPQPTIGPYKPSFTTRLKNAIHLPGPLPGDPNLRALAAPDVPKNWTEQPMLEAREFTPEVQKAVQGAIGAGNVPEYGVPPAPTQQQATIQTVKAPPNVVARGVGSAIADTAESLTRPDVAVPLAALGAGAAATGPISVGTAAVGLAFDAQMVQGLIEKSPQFRQAWDAGDTEGMIRIGTSMGIDAALLGTAVAHRVATMRQAPSIKAQPIEPPYADVVQERLRTINDASLMGEYRAAEGDPVYQAEIRAQALERGLAWAKPQPPAAPPSAGQIGGQPAPPPAGPKPPAVGPAPVTPPATVDPDLAAKAVAAVEGKYRVGVKALAKSLNVERPVAEGLFGWLEENGHVIRGTNKAGEVFFKPVKQPTSPAPPQEAQPPAPVQVTPDQQTQQQAQDPVAIQAEIDRLKAENAKLRGEELPAPAPLETKLPAVETEPQISETQPAASAPAAVPVETMPAPEPVERPSTPVEEPSTPVEKGVEAATEVQPAVEAKPPHKFGSTQVNLPEPLAGKMREAAARIPDEDLAEDGREDEPHITVKYGLKDDSPASVDKLRNALANIPPIRVRMGKTSIFPEGEPGKGDVVKVDVDSPDLHALNQLVKDTVDTEDTHPTYTPHATLGYVKAGLGKKYEGDTSLDGAEASFDHILVSTRDRQKIPIRLGGKPEVAPAQIQPGEPEESNEHKLRLKSSTQLRFIPQQLPDGQWVASADRQVQGFLGGHAGESAPFLTKEEALADVARKAINGLQADVINASDGMISEKHRAEAKKLQQWAMQYIPEDRRPPLRDRNQWAEVLAKTTPQDAVTQGFSARRQGDQFSVHAPDGTMIAWAKGATDEHSAIVDVHGRAVRSFPQKEQPKAETPAHVEASPEPATKGAESIPENIPAPEPVVKPEVEPGFRKGDRVRYTDKQGKKLTGTVRRDYSPSDPGVDVDVDQIAKPGGVPIGRLEYWPKHQVQRETEAEAPQAGPKLESIKSPDLQAQDDFPVGSPVEFERPDGSYGRGVVSRPAEGSRVFVQPNAGGVERGMPVGRVRKPAAPSVNRMNQAEAAPAPVEVDIDKQRGLSEAEGDVTAARQVYEDTLADFEDEAATPEQMGKAIKDLNAALDRAEKAREALAKTNPLLAEQPGKGIERVAVPEEANKAAIQSMRDNYTDLTDAMDNFSYWREEGKDVETADKRANLSPALARAKTSLETFDFADAEKVISALREEVARAEEAIAGPKQETAPAEQPQTEDLAPPAPLDDEEPKGTIKAGEGDAQQPGNPDQGPLETDVSKEGKSPAGGRRTRSGGGKVRGSRGRGDRGLSSQGDELEPGAGNRAGGVGDDTSIEDNRPPRPTSSNAKRFERDYRIPDGRRISGSPEVRAERNIKAIRLMRELTEQQRPATVAEQEVLAGYVGWGAVPQIFAANTPEWAKRDRELRDLLSPSEYESARRSTTNAHYTGDDVVDAMWKAMQRMGAKPGMSWLEPAFGVGNFFGRQPAELLDGARRVGIEKDELTGRIGQLLYPDSGVEITPFEKSDLPNEFFDAAISNVPFGNFGVTDPTYKSKPYLTDSIHNYFFAKSLDLVRPGGIVAFITSRYTMDGYDKPHKAFRAYIATKADFLGAIRLPSGAFRQNAGTDVITDIILLRKRLPNADPAGEDWKHTESITLRVEGESWARPVAINRYYTENPDMVLGEHGLARGQHSSTDYDVKGSLTPEKLEEAISRLPENQFMKGKRAVRTGLRVASVKGAETAKVGAFFFDGNGKLHIRTSRGGVEPFEAPKPTIARITGQLGIRDTLVALLEAERTDQPLADLDKLRKELNRKYDAYVAKHGLLSSRANISVIDGDPDAPLLLSLEKDYNKDKKTAAKTAIFSGRMLEPARRVDRVDNSKDALTASLNEFGRIDWEHMEALSGKTAEMLQSDLSGLVYEDPVSHTWQIADDYLSGSVRKKLREARAAAKLDPRFEVNVKALEATQPEDIPPNEIDVRLGVSWVPPDTYIDFVHHLTGVDRNQISVEYFPAMDEWVVNYPEYQQRIRKWETKRASVPVLLKAAFNSRQVKIYDGSGKDAVVDPVETTAANARVNDLHEEFQRWLFLDDAARSATATRLYNDVNNDLRLPTPDGSHLTLPGMSKSPAVLRGGDLDPHQKNAVWRIISQPNVLLAHAVGAGKTFEMIAGGMELKRLGLANRPMYVVPNQTLTGWQEQFAALYPGRRFIVFGEADLEKKKRQRAMARVATGNWDAVVVPQSSFGLIPVSEDLFNEHFQGLAAEMEAAITDAEAAGMDTRMIKRMEKAKESLLASLEKRRAADKKDNLVTWEQLGIDQLFVDESHNYKKLGFSTKMGGVAGIDTGGNQRTFDLMMKLRHTQKHGRGVVFATGTPITNTIGELYSIMRYLIPQELEARGMRSFDEWAANYGRTINSFERKAEGGGHRVKQRFASFVNLPELITLFRSFADVVTSDMLKMPRPELKGGGRIIVTSTLTPAQEDAIEDLQIRAAAIRSNPREALPDNMLAIFGDGQKIAMDLRLMDAKAAADPEGRVAKASEQIYKIWDETKEKRSTQVVFSDIGKPTAFGGKEFSLYDAIIDELKRRGIPASEIAHIYEAKTKQQRKTLFQKVRDGEVRIIFGSTEKLGVGVNIQDKLIALHNLDVPHRPSDFEQRDGRLIRQGNENKEVYAFQYITEKSLEELKFGGLVRKQKFVTQALQGKSTVRRSEDVDEMVLTFEQFQAIASGDPRVFKMLELTSEIDRMSAVRSAWASQRYSMSSELANNQAAIPRNRERIDWYKKQQAITEKRKGEFSLEGHPAFSGDDLKEKWTKALESLEPDTFTDGKFSGVFLRVQKFLKDEVAVKDEKLTTVQVPVYRALLQGFDNRESTSPSGLLQQMANELSLIPDHIARHERWIEKDLSRNKEISEELAKPWPQQAKLNKLVEERDALQKEMGVGKDDQSAVTLDDNGEIVDESVEAEEQPDDNEEDVEGESDEKPPRSGWTPATGGGLGAFQTLFDRFSQPDPATGKPITKGKIRAIHTLASKIDMPRWRYEELLGQYKVTSSKSLSDKQAKDFIERLKAVDQDGKPLFQMTTPILPNVAASPSVVMSRSAAAKTIWESADKAEVRRSRLTERFQRKLARVVEGLTADEKQNIAVYRYVKQMLHQDSLLDDDGKPIAKDPYARSMVYLKLVGEDPDLVYTIEEDDYLPEKLDKVNDRLTAEVFKPMHQAAVRAGLIEADRYYDDYLPFFREEWLQQKGAFDIRERAQEFAEEIGIPIDLAEHILKNALVKKARFGPIDLERQQFALPGKMKLEDIGDVYIKGWARKMALSKFIKQAEPLVSKIGDENLRDYSRAWVNQFMGRRDDAMRFTERLLRRVMIRNPRLNRATWQAMKATGTSHGETQVVTPQMVASFLTAMQYHAKISLNAWTALQNLTQVVNTIAAGGALSTLKGIPRAIVAQAVAGGEVRESLVLGKILGSMFLPRHLNPVYRDLVRLRRAGVLDTFSMKYERPVSHGIRDKVTGAMTWLFSESEQFNRRTAFFTGYVGAIKEGKPEAEAIQAGRDLVRATQFFGGRLDGILWSRSVGGRMMMQFKSYPIKQAEFVFRHLDNKGRMRYLLATLMMGGPAAFMILQMMQKVAPDWWATEMVQGLQESFNIAAILGVQRLYQSLGLYAVPTVEKLNQYDASWEIAKFLAGPNLNAMLDSILSAVRAVDKNLSDSEAKEKALDTFLKTMTRSWAPGGVQVVRWWKTMENYDIQEDPEGFLRSLAGLETPKKAQ